MRITSNIKANIRQTLRDLPDGRQVYDIILDQIPSQEDEITISCEWDFPICNIAGRWHPNCRYDRTLKADWAHGEISMSSVSAPLNVFFSTDGRNIKTIAVSEAEKKVNMNVGVHEENGTMKCRVKVFAGAVETPAYKVRILLDDRDVRYEQAIGDAVDWWETDCGFRPAFVPDEARDPMYSFWYSYHQEFTEEDVEAECRRAAELGFRTVIVDDGWQNYVDAWNAQPFATFLKNSVTVTVLSALGSMVSAALVAYGFARFQFRGKNVLFMLLLSTMMIPWDVTMIPQYMEFNAFGWLNTLKPLIIPSWFGSAYYIFLMRQFLMGVPKDFEEAARIDGANSFQIFYKIYVPIMKPSLILVGVLNMLSAWNDYLGPLIFLQERSKYTLALGLASFKGVYSESIVPMLCITVIMILPPILIFLFAQRYIIEGTGGAIK